MVLDSGLTNSVSWSICNIMVTTHPKYQMPESLAGELQELAIGILELHVLSDFSPDKTFMQSLESLIHVLNMRTVNGWKIAERAVAKYKLSQLKTGAPGAGSPSAVAKGAEKGVTTKSIGDINSLEGRTVIKPTNN
jgi:hypothetical protein